MLVHHDDIVHADYQGAVVIPADCVAGVAEAVALVSRREKVILDACRDRAFSSRNCRRRWRAPRKDIDGPAGRANGRT